MNAAEDEISLVDLFAVLLRYRRMIALAAALAAAGAALAYAVVPGLRYARAKENLRAEAVYRAVPSPAAQLLVDSRELLSYAQSVVSDPVVLLGALGDAGYDKLADLELGGGGGRALSAVRQRLIENRGRSGTALNAEDRLYHFELKDGTLQLSFKDPDEDKALAFVDAMHRRVNVGLFTMLAPVARAEVENYERLSAMDSLSAAVSEALAKNYLRYAAARRYLDGSEAALISIQDPYVLAPVLELSAMRRDVLKQGLLAFVAVVFLALLAAFVRHWAAGVKADPEAMRKLREAAARRS